MGCMLKINTAPPWSRLWTSPSKLQLTTISSKVFWSSRQIWTHHNWNSYLVTCSKSTLTWRLSSFYGSADRLRLMNSHSNWKTSSISSQIMMLNHLHNKVCWGLKSLSRCMELTTTGFLTQKSVPHRSYPLRWPKVMLTWLSIQLELRLQIKRWANLAHSRWGLIKVLQISSLANPRETEIC